MIMVNFERYYRALVIFLAFTYDYCGVIVGHRLKTFIFETYLLIFYETWNVNSEFV